MKKTFQIERKLSIPARTSKIFNFQLKESYAKCTGFFLTPDAVGADLSNVELSLNIAQMEVLPSGADASLFAITSHVSREEATYKFAEENIPARSSDVQLTFNNKSHSTVTVNAYFVLEN